MLTIPNKIFKKSVVSKTVAEIGFKYSLNFHSNLSVWKKDTKFILKNITERFTLLFSKIWETFVSKSKLLAI